MQSINVLIAAKECAAVGRLRAAVSSDPALRLAAFCSSWENALEESEKLKPDVIALDMRLEGCGGCGAAGELDRKCGAPVVAMDAAAGYALAALDAGAADFVLIPVEGSDSDNGFFTVDVLERIKTAAVPSGKAERTLPAKKPVRLLAVFTRGAGPVQLACMLNGLTASGLTVLIVHAGATYSRDKIGEMLEKRTGRKTRFDADALEPGNTYVIRGGARVRLENATGRLLLRLAGDSPTGGEADGFFSSVGKALGQEAACVLCSDSGDGFDGLRKAAANGALAIAENKNSILREIGFKLPGGVLELALEDIPGEVLKRM